MLFPISESLGGRFFRLEFIQLEDLLVLITDLSNLPFVGIDIKNCKSQYLKSA